MPNNPRLTQVQKDFILLLKVVKPAFTHEQMQSIFNSKFEGYTLTERQLKWTLKKLRPQIAETQASEQLTFGCLKC